MRERETKGENAIGKKNETHGHFKNNGREIKVDDKKNKASIYSTRTIDKMSRRQKKEKKQWLTWLTAFSHNGGYKSRCRSMVYITYINLITIHRSLYY
jgi:hypothetical protein